MKEKAYFGDNIFLERLVTMPQFPFLPEETGRVATASPYT